MNPTGVSLFCWRCGARRVSLEGPCASCKRACPRRRRHWREGAWQLAVGGEHFANLDDQALVWYVARAAFEHGISPLELLRHFRANARLRFYALRGRIGASEFSVVVRRLHGEVTFQCIHDEDLFFSDEKTWAITAQPGQKTGHYIRVIGREFPQLSLRLEEGRDRRSQ